jgi:hypothetical protein
VAVGRNVLGELSRRVKRRDICGSRLGDDVLDEAVQQLCSILDGQLRICSKLLAS